MDYELTRLSSRGQVVIPEKTRKLIGLRTGTKFAIYTDGKNILLQPLTPPDVSAFRKMAEEATKVAEQAKAKRKEAKL